VTAARSHPTPGTDRRHARDPSTAGNQPTATDPSIERTLRRLELTVTRRLDGLLLGDHLGLIPGSGTDTADSRPYHVGDDIRRMDWAVTARTTVPHVHDLIADRELETWALVDLTASLEFGTAAVDKRDLAIATVAAVGYLTARGGNRLGAYVLSGSGLRVLPARTGRDGLRALLRALLRTPRSALDRPARSPDHTASTDLAAAVGRLRNPPRRRGLTIVISDFLSTDMSWERPLRALTGRHQVLAVEILDPRERELPSVGLLTVMDPETGATLTAPTSSRRLRESYARAAAAHGRAVEAALRRAGAAHLTLRTDTDWLTEIVRFVLTTRRRRGMGRRPPMPSLPTGTPR
jgi:uncharacterized protein (DUF58 family)